MIFFKLFPYTLVFVMIVILSLFVVNDRNTSRSIYSLEFDDDLIVKNLSRVLISKEKSNGRDIVVIQMTGEFSFSKSVNLVEMDVNSKDEIPRYIGNLLGIQNNGEIFRHFRTSRFVFGQWRSFPVVVTDDRKTILVNVESLKLRTDKNN